MRTDMITVTKQNLSKKKAIFYYLFHTNIRDLFGILRFLCQAIELRGSFALFLAI